MSDFATLRSTHETSFTSGVGREVVVVHVTLAGDIAEGVDHLLHAGHTERGDVEDLSLATLEQTRTMH